MPPILLIIGTMILLDIVWWSLSHRWLKNQRGWRIANTIFLVIQFLAIGFLFAGRLAGIRWSLPTLLMSSLYLWHLLILPTLLVIGVLLLPLLIFLFLRRMKRPARMQKPGVSSLPTQIAAAPGEEIPGVQTRRQFLITSAIVAPPLINLALTGYSQRQIEQFRVREMTLALPNLPSALSGLTICHITDLHVGPFTSERVIRRVSEKVNALRADLVLLTGDLINSKLSELPLGLAFIRSLYSRYGVASIEGNHDLFEGRAPFARAFRDSGLRLLVNEVEMLRVRDHPVQLLGLRWGGPGEMRGTSGDEVIRASFDELIAGRDPDGAFPILLAHHPHAFDPASAAGLPLTLAGHTHGGQLMLNPRVGAGPLLFRYWSGLYTRGNSRLIVGNGVGNWYPLRTAAPAEVIHLTLRRAV